MEQAEIGRKIRIHRMGKYRQETVEVELEEARRIVREASGKFLVIDRKAHEIIAEIGPDVEEIAIKPLLIAGG